jgi:hypothetical protein
MSSDRASVPNQSGRAKKQSQEPGMGDVELLNMPQSAQSPTQKSANPPGLPPKVRPGSLGEHLVPRDAFA